MDCFACGYSDTGGDFVRCWQGDREGKRISREESIKGCKYIDCTGEEWRHPIQIAPAEKGVKGTLYALCNDHTIWSYAVGAKAWSRIKGIPQRKKGEEVDGAR